MDTFAVYIGNHLTPIEHLLLRRWEWNWTLTFPPPELVALSNPETRIHIEQNNKEKSADIGVPI